ncbi:uncharacterized protein STAUR_2213 [Stigmatella aurantiaca DW4/3-1]|uniref:Uncharacterized protein n=1 Tax=Stigmatella aurantiaca (strain DW4/3-1) TaxID=378806 RepID=E3FC94_STIAD|nr:uncharacterized protein STAUR_2213 [Stigmatella aurantiaca DW4/3-1]
MSREASTSTKVSLPRAEAGSLLDSLQEELSSVDVIRPEMKRMTDATTTNSQGALEATRVIPSTARIRAISWLVSGAYAQLHKSPSMRMRLSVTRGSAQYLSVGGASTVQWVDFVAPETGSYAITIQRTFNSGVGDVALALSVGEVV